MVVDFERSMLHGRRLYGLMLREGQRKYRPLLEYDFKEELAVVVEPIAKSIAR